MLGELDRDHGSHTAEESSDYGHTRGQQGGDSRAAQGEPHRVDFGEAPITVGEREEPREGAASEESDSGQTSGRSQDDVPRNGPRPCGSGEDGQAADEPGRRPEGGDSEGTSR